MKKTVELRSKLPPIYNAKGKTVGIAANDSVVTIALEKQLTQSDSSIQVVGANPDLQIDCEISQNSPIHNVTTSDSSGSAVHMEGNLTVIFRISEVKARRVIKANIATSAVDEILSMKSNAMSASKVFGVKVPGTGAQTVNRKSRFSSSFEAQNYLVAQIAIQIASYLVNTEESITVPLAQGGPLGSANKLAESALWPRYLESLETMKPYPDPKDDAYRQYNIGVANEALAYSAQDNASAIKYLEQASIDYGKSFDAKPEEKPFIESQGRIKAALQHYADIGKTSGGSDLGSLQSSLMAKPAAGASGGMTNKDVIDLVAAHLDDANLVDSIINARDVDFDLSTQGLIALTKAGVKGNIVAAMKQRERGPTAPPKRR